jgi:esterase/lipase
VKLPPAQIACICCILIFFVKPAWSLKITVSLPNNVTANADYRTGEAEKPVVFLLHGFMATHNLNIIQIMADELESQGYSVIAPTLSLKINNRHSGANCDAVHTHTMESDIEEIAWWVDWLKSKNYKDIVMAGFSTGGLQVAIYLSHNNPDVIKKAVLVSPAYLAGSPFPQAEEKADIATAKNMLAKSENQLHEFHLSYCKGNFIAPPKVFLSYKEWTDARLLEVVQKIKVPRIAIIGGEDHRFGTKLSRQFKKIDLPVIIISGANHFFDSPYEFDFLDQFTREVLPR